MSEQQYRLEENKQTNELILWEDAKIFNVFKSSYDNRKHLNIIVDRLNEQQNIIRELRNENIISKNKIEDLRVSLFMLNKELGRQMQKSGLDDK